MIKDDSKTIMTLSINMKDRGKIRKSIWRNIKNKIRKKEFKNEKY